MHCGDLEYATTVHADEACRRSCGRETAVLRRAVNVVVGEIVALPVPTGNRRGARLVPNRESLSRIANWSIAESEVLDALARQVLVFR